MSEFFFVLKTLGITIAILLCLQIKVGPRTIENHTTNWMRGSNAVMALRGVAGGAVAFGETAVDWATGIWEKNIAGKPTHRTDWRKEAQSSEADTD